MARLIFNYPFMQKEYIIDKDLFIGRGKENNLTIPDYKMFLSLTDVIKQSYYLQLRKVSRRHAKIFLKKGNFFIVDIGTTNMGSTYGTFINANRIESGQPYQINDRDKISFGSIECIFKED